MKKLVKFFLPTWFVFFIFSCSYTEINKEAPSINAVNLNSKFRINLPEEHSSGYIWQLSESYDRNLLENINTVWHGNKKGVDFNFLTRAMGTTTLTFVLRKHIDTTEIKHFVVNIKAL